MDRVEMLLRLALAAQRFVELGGIAMRLNRGGIAIERTQETAERRLVLLALAVQQSKPQMDLGAGGDDRGGTEQMAQRALQIALAFEQRGEAQMRFEIAGLAPDQVAVNRQCLQRVPFGNAPRLFEPFADAGGAKAVFDLAGWALGAKIERSWPVSGSIKTPLSLTTMRPSSFTSLSEVTERPGSTRSIIRLRQRCSGSRCRRSRSRSLASRMTSRSLNAKRYLRPGDAAGF